MKKILIILSILALGLIVSACGNPKKVPVSSEIREGLVRQYSVIAKDFEFTPNQFYWRAGETIKVKFKNKGTVNHNFKFEGTNISTKSIGADVEEVIEFTVPEEPGIYSFYCSIPGHRQKGMEGQIEVIVQD